MSAETYATPPVAWSTADLRSARLLSLSGVAETLAAVALVDELTALVCDWESAKRGNKRRVSGIAKLTQALGGLTSGLLLAWARDKPCAVFRTRSRSSFTGATIGQRQFIAAADGMQALGLISVSRSVRFQGVAWDAAGGAWEGLATRLRPTAALLRLAGRHGVVPGKLPADFRSVYSTVAPSVLEAVVMRTLKTRTGGLSLPARRISIPAADPKAQALRSEVEAFNGFVAQHDVHGCLPPRFRRVFTESWSMGGRWTAVGSDGVYQTMPLRTRLMMTIDGEGVAEVDASASHLSILHGLMGLSAPEGELYAAGGFPRDVVKRWINVTLGKGKPMTRWPADTDSMVSFHDARSVGAAVTARYPFLGGSWASTDCVAMADNPGLLPHRLMNVEAAALTNAMMTLRAGNIVALPMHDGLIVPASAAEVVSDSLRAAYLEVAGVAVRVTRAG